MGVAFSAGWASVGIGALMSRRGLTAATEEVGEVKGGGV